MGQVRPCCCLASRPRSIERRFASTSGWLLHFGVVVANINSLASNAADYVSILLPRDNPRWNEYNRVARDSLFTISRELGGERIRPLILAISRHFSIREAEKAFKLMVSWSVRFLIAGGGGGGVLDKSYGTTAREVTRGTITTVKQLRERMNEVVPNDEVFKTAFAAASVRKTNLARYYLRAIELFLRDEKQPQLLPNDDTSSVNIRACFASRAFGRLGYF